MRLPATLACLLLLSACSNEAAPPADTTTATPPPATTPAPESTPPPAPAPPAFTDIAWRADTGSGVEIGTTYTFKPDGTLIVDSPNGTPMTGAWRQVDGQLTMTEEGIDYPTDVLAQDADHLHLRSNNPGGAVELLLVRDTAAPAP
jgi:hypothetical protein